MVRGKKKLYNVSFRCYYEGNETNHRQWMMISEIDKWIECYLYTHPAVKSITAKVWFNDEEEQNATSESPNTS